MRDTRGVRYMEQVRVGRPFIVIGRRAAQRVQLRHDKAKHCLFTQDYFSKTPNKARVIAAFVISCVPKRHST